MYFGCRIRKINEYKKHKLVNLEITINVRIRTSGNKLCESVLPLQSATKSRTYGLKKKDRTVYKLCIELLNFFIQFTIISSFDYWKSSSTSWLLQRMATIEGKMENVEISNESRFCLGLHDCLTRRRRCHGKRSNIGFDIGFVCSRSRNLQ